MNTALGIPLCLKDYEGGFIGEQEFLEKLPAIAQLALSDACTLSNPRTPTQKEMEDLLKSVYYDR